MGMKTGLGLKSTEIAGSAGLMESTDIVTHAENQPRLCRNTESTTEEFGTKTSVLADCVISNVFHNTVKSISNRLVTSPPVP